MKGTTYKSIINFLKLAILFIFWKMVMNIIYFPVNTRIIYTIFMLIASFAVFCFLYVKNDFTKINNKKTSRILKLLKKNNYKYDVKSNIYYKDEKYKDYIVEAIKNINEKQFQEFKDKGFLLIVGDLLNTKNTSGLFSHGEKYIIIYTKNYSKQEVISTFYHEWGHFLDFYWNYISDSPTFKMHFIKNKNYINNSIRFLYGNSMFLYQSKHTYTNLYEYTSSSEYLAVNYSRWKRNELSSTFLCPIFEYMDKQ